MTTTDLYRLLETELNSPERSAAENLTLAEQVELAGSDAVRRRGRWQGSRPAVFGWGIGS